MQKKSSSEGPLGQNRHLDLSIGRTIIGCAEVFAEDRDRCHIILIPAYANLDAARLLILR